MKTYRLASSPPVNTPGLLRWAQNGYHFEKDRPNLLYFFIQIFQGPQSPSAQEFDRLLRGDIPHTVEPSEHGGVVVFDVCNYEDVLCGLGTSLKLAFNNSGLTMTQLQHRVGYDEDRLQDIFAGIDIFADAYAKVAAALNVSLTTE